MCCPPRRLARYAGVGHFDQTVGGAGIFREDRDSDAGGDGFVGGMGGEKRRHDLGGNLLGRSAVFQFGEQYHELVAAEARHRVAGAHAVAQQVGGFEQRPVAGRMPAQVIDAPEIVEVHENHPNPFVIALGPGDGLVQPVGEQAPVGQAGEGVVVGEVADPLRAANLFGDVVGGAVVAEEGAVFVQPRHAAQQEPARSVLAVGQFDRQIAESLAVLESLA